MTWLPASETIKLWWFNITATITYHNNPNNRGNDSKFPNSLREKNQQCQGRVWFVYFCSQPQKRQGRIDVVGGKKGRMVAFHMIPSESKPEGSRNKQLLMTHVTPDWYSACDRDIPRFYVFIYIYVFNSWAGSCDLFKEQAIIGDQKHKKITVP